MRMVTLSCAAAAVLTKKGVQAASNVKLRRDIIDSSSLTRDFSIAARGRPIFQERRDVHGRKRIPSQNRMTLIFTIMPVNAQRNWLAMNWLSAADHRGLHCAQPALSRRQ